MPKTFRERYLSRSPTLPTPVSLPSASSIGSRQPLPASPGMTWLYVSSVMETLEWPSVSETIFGCTLLVSSSVAQVCLSEGNPVSSNPARLTASFGAPYTSPACGLRNRIYAMSRMLMVPSGPTRTTEGSAVVAIAVDRRGVGRHNSCVSAAHSQEELHPTLTCMEL